MDSTILTVGRGDSIDEGWIEEWLQFGFAEMESYLGRQAAFEAYYERRAHRLVGAGALS